MPKFGVKEGVATLFSGFIQAAGKQRLQSYLMNQRNQAELDREERNVLREKIDNPETPALVKMSAQERYKGSTGKYWPMDMEALAPVPGQREQTAEPADLNYFLKTGSTADIENYMKKSAERQKILQQTETSKAQAGASKALTEERTAKADLTRKQIGQVGKTKPTTPKEPKDQRLAILKEQFDTITKRRQSETMDALDKIIDPKKYKEYTAQLDDIQTQTAELLQEQNKNIKIPVIGWGSTKK